jgi:predicted lipoprotein
MLSWQRAELFRFGPAARSTEPGGQDLRDLIYAWPVQPECKVDEQTVSRSYETPGFHSLDFAVSPVNGRTLSALEYLWFGSAEQNHCSQFSSINSSGSWAALPATELAQRRRRYAAEAAIDVRARAAQLVEAWAPSGGNFRARLVAAGGDPFNSEQHALNAISNALFYFDLELKDDKLATPLGLAPECSQSACPDAVESTYTDLSMEYIRQNVVGFRRLFEGCGPDYAGIGFDDWLRDVGAGELADRMLASTRGVEAAIDRVPGSLAQALVDNRALPLAVYDAVKVVTDELKTEFVTVLNLELPAAAEGDND